MRLVSISDLGRVNDSLLLDDKSLNKPGIRMKERIVAKIRESNVMSPFFGQGIQWRESWSICFIFPALYFILAVLFFKFASLHGSVSPVWPPAGLALLGALVLGPRAFFMIFVSAFASNLFNSGMVLSSFLVALGNTLEAFVACLLFNSVYRRIQAVQFEMSFFGALFVSGLLASFVGALSGITSLVYTAGMPWESAKPAIVTWAMGDWIGMLMAVPLGYLFEKKDLEILQRYWKHSTFKLVLHVSLFGLMMVGLYLAAFESSLIKFIFCVFFILLYVFQFSNRIAIAGASIFIAMIFYIVTLKGAGPFNLSKLNDNLLNLDIFLCSFFALTAALIGLYRSRQKKFIYMTFSFGWIFWGLTFYSIQSKKWTEDRAKIENFLEQVSEFMSSEYYRLNGLLTGGAALFQASNSVEVGEWKDYYDHISKFYNLPGVRGMGVVFSASEKDLPSFQAKFRKEMDADFSIRQVGSKSLDPDGRHLIITYIEPLESNRPARGLDISTEPRRYRAAQRAIRTGTSTITEAIQLVQEQKKVPGFLFYLPVYKRNADVSSEELRMKAFSHFIYCPVIAEDFFAVAAKKVGPEFRLTVIESLSDDLPRAAQEPETILFDESSKKINSNYPAISKVIEIGGRSYVFKYQATLAFQANQDFISTWIILIGALSVLLVVLFVVGTLNNKDRVSKLASRLFNDYSESLVRIQNQEMKIAQSSKMASLGEMAAGVAHEINNPLAVISAAIYQIEKRAKASGSEVLAEEVFKFTLRIKEMTNRMSTIVRGLRQFARDGEQDPKEHVRLEMIIQDTLVLCNERFKNRGVDLRLDLQFSGEIFCREVQISQVLLNLLNNSFDAISELSSSKLDSPSEELPWIRIRSYQSGESVVISIEDSGPGIPEHLRNKVLQPFFTTKEVGKGTGLGLSISKGIIESHGGDLSLDPHEKYTCFKITLPIAQVANRAA